jgi:hypothetical protein
MVIAGWVMVLAPTAVVFGCYACRQSQRRMEWITRYFYADCAVEKLRSKAKFGGVSTLLVGSRICLLRAGEMALGLGGSP